MNTRLVTLAVAAIAFAAPFAHRDLDRYPGFTAYVSDFGRNPTFPRKWNELPRRGNDVTSCLYRRRIALVKILDKASIPSKLSEINTELEIRMDGRVWIMDGNGVVRHESRDLALRDEDFADIRARLASGLPANDGSLFKPLKDRRIEPPR